MIHLETERLILRPWEDRDLDAFAAMNADPDVMRYFPAVMSRDETAAMIEKARARTVTDGICFMPVERKADRVFLGFVGLSRPAYLNPLPFDPCVEIGWRLARHAWGQGYATEAAREWLRFGFGTLGVDEIVSFTARGNLPSQKVMQRLGMARNRADDFLHPMLESDHPLASHVLYRLART
ncbi:GNAT family N-acetyltransferase [Pannonibacter sp.]|uniref:GNAT family N-acetyltransferase n=1 Tax=Pannonibacter sp. TaxID=1906786 RepID=UPI003F6EF2C7